MSSVIHLSSISHIGKTSTFLDLVQIGGGAAAPSLESTLPLSWEKIVHSLNRHSVSETVMALNPAKSVMSNIPTIIKPTPTLEEVLNGPLFQVSGILEIDDHEWIDRIDEYIAETYL